MTETLRVSMLQRLTATVTATAAAHGNQRRPATAHNARTIRANLGYVRPEKQTVGGQAPRCGHEPMRKAQYSSKVQQRPLTTASQHDRQHTELAGATDKRPAAPLVRDEEAHARRVPDRAVAREASRPLADNTAGIATWLDACEAARPYPLVCWRGSVGDMLGVPARRNVGGLPPTRRRRILASRNLSSPSVTVGQPIPVKRAWFMYAPRRP
jgi:hypothetical protein